MRYERPMIELLRLLQGDLLLASNEADGGDIPGGDDDAGADAGGSSGNGRPLPPDMFG